MGQYKLVLPKVPKRGAGMSRRQRVARERTLAGETVSQALQAIRKEAHLTQGQACRPRRHVAARSESPGE